MMLLRSPGRPPGFRRHFPVFYTGYLPRYGPRFVHRAYRQPPQSSRWWPAGACEPSTSTTPRLAATSRTFASSDSALPALKTISTASSLTTSPISASAPAPSDSSTSSALSTTSNTPSFFLQSAPPAVKSISTTSTSTSCFSPSSPLLPSTCCEPSPPPLPPSPLSTLEELEDKLGELKEKIEARLTELENFVKEMPLALGQNIMELVCNDKKDLVSRITAEFVDRFKKHDIELDNMNKKIGDTVELLHAYLRTQAWDVDDFDEAMKGKTKKKKKKKQQKLGTLTEDEEEERCHGTF